MPYQVIILFIVTIIGTILSYFLLRSDRRAVNILFSIFSITAALWSLNLGLFLNARNLNNALSFANFYYIAAAAIPLVFFYFSLFFKRENYHFNKNLLWLLTPFFLIVYSILVDRNFIVEQIFQNGVEKDVILNFRNYFIYTIYFVSFVVLSYFGLLKSYNYAKDRTIRDQLRLVVFGTLIGFVLGMIFNLFLPAFGNYNLIWVGPLSIIIMVSSISYAIIRYKLFNLKVIATEVFVFFLWTFILIRTILSTTSQDQLANGILLLAVTIIGIFLIRSVIREVEQREKLERLTEELGKANDRLKGLDELKTEFLSLACHQFRSPLTAIKGYASLVLEGSYGKVNPSVKEAIDKIFQSSDNLVDVVQDFLDVSQIEQGRIKYEMEKVDMKLLVEEIIGELRPNISKAGLEIIIDAPRESYFVDADKGKLNQVVINLIDNAQKYTKEGSIKISIEKEDGKVVTRIIDTGVGINEDDIGKLFGKFTRTTNSKKTNVNGTGLGLYIVKKIVEAHKGRIWVESSGVGKGSTFFIELDQA